LKQVEYDLSTVLTQVEADLMQRQFAAPGDKVSIVGGVPFGKVGSANFLKIHTIAQH
jgi:pyruvate kinase